MTHTPKAEGVNHNLVAICRIRGMPAQQAFDRINELLKDCYRDWYLALADLPQWGEKTDTEVQKYVQGVQNVVLANLNWRYVVFSLDCNDKDEKTHQRLTHQNSCSFKSERYLGKSHDVVRQNRRISVMPRLVDEIVANRDERGLHSPNALSARFYGACCLLLMLLASIGISLSTAQFGLLFSMKG